MCILARIAPQHSCACKILCAEEWFLKNIKNIRLWQVGSASICCLVPVGTGFRVADGSLLQVKEGGTDA